MGQGRCLWSIGRIVRVRDHTSPAIDLVGGNRRTPQSSVAYDVSPLIALLVNLIADKG